MSDVVDDAKRAARNCLVHVFADRDGGEEIVV
jgi:hypothetical protein